MNGKKLTIEDAMDYYKYNVSKNCEAKYIIQYKGTGEFTWTEFERELIDGLTFYIIGSIKEFEDYTKMQKLNSINKEAVKSVYTQEMADNGELPPAGSEVLHTGFINDFENKEDFKDGDQLIIISHYEDGVIFRRKEHDSHGLVVSHTCNERHFKPLDTRKDEEKLIDDLTATIESYENNKSITEKVLISNTKDLALDLINKFDIKLK